MRRLAVVVCLALAGCGQQPADTTPPTHSASTPSARSTVTPSPTVTRQPRLGPQARAALAEAERSGARTVTLTVSTEPGLVERVVAGLRDLGAAVESSDARIGYVRATVPVDVAERVPAVEGVRQVDVDEPLSNGDPTP